jgi:hypothetical protein
MSLFCFFGRHTPSIASINRRKAGGHSALCEVCACPLERDEKSRWRVAEALVERPK